MQKEQRRRHRRRRESVPGGDRDRLHPASTRISGAARDLLTSHHSRGGGAWLLLLGEQCPGRSGSSAFANKNPAFLGSNWAYRAATIAAVVSKNSRRFSGIASS